MTTAIAPIKKVEDLAAFIEERVNMRNSLNYEAETLRVKMKEESEKHKETVLFSIPLNETRVTLSEYTVRSLFVEAAYPYDGLLVREIQIVLQEKIDRSGDYFLDFVIRFKFENEAFNTDHGRDGSLDNLLLDDSSLCFKDCSAGVCLDPYFVEKEKYELAMAAFVKAKEEISKLLE